MMNKIMYINLSSEYSNRQFQTVCSCGNQGLRIALFFCILMSPRRQYIFATLALNVEEQRSSVAQWLLIPWKPYYSKALHPTWGRGRSQTVI